MNILNFMWANRSDLWRMTIEHIVMVGIAILMIRLPLANAGHPDEPAPPTAIM